VKHIVVGLTDLILVAWLRCGGIAVAEDFAPTWESVGVKDDAPEWLQDAKFGIYTHWGLQTHLGAIDVPNSVWYYNQMYKKGSPVFEYHKKTYGDQSAVGYKDLIDDFKAKDFNAEIWANTFYDAGARFAGMVVIHHDNVAMYDSRITPYNVVRLGPKRDITGELEKAYSAKGMPFLATFHNMATWHSCWHDAYEYDAKGGEFAEIYNEPHKKGDPIPRSYLDRQVGFVKEVVERYKPDGIWFDYGLYNALQEPDRLELASYYYNWGEANDKDVVLIHKHGIKLPTGILNTERGRLGELREKTWMNDESIGVRYWFQNADRFKAAGNFSGKYLTHVIIDLASKNGTFLLNVAPDKHGVIPDNQREVLGVIGGWLRKYGEAIYSTRPWTVYGEGPFQLRFPGKIGGKNPAQRIYSTRDIRFTRSKDGKTIYAIFMGPPKRNIPIRSMVVKNKELLKACRWLGHGNVEVSVDRQGHPLVDISSVQGDASKDIAYAIAIPAAAVEYVPAGEVATTRIDLSVDTAAITGDSIRLETIDADDGIRALRPWTNKKDTLSWMVEIPETGTWRVVALTKARKPSRLDLSLGGQSSSFAVAPKGTSRRPAKTESGDFDVSAPGTHKLTLAAAKTAGGWVPVEIYGLTIVPTTSEVVDSGPAQFLPAADAVLHGNTFHKGRSVIAHWQNSEEWVEWTFSAVASGLHRVILEYASPHASHIAVAVSTEGGDPATPLKSPLPARENWGDTGKHCVGNTNLQANRKYRLSVRPREPWQPVNLRSVILQPARELCRGLPQSATIP
jgi:alpha-L-fucosidase